jgi:hypothetical protein
LAAKIISQKKFAKLVSSTGVLSQPPGSISRLSNLLFTQRGSLQISDGSAPISSPLSPLAIFSALSSFANLQPGQFPTYAALAYPPSPTLADVTNFLLTGFVAGSNNPAGTYIFNIVANLGVEHTNAANSQITVSLPAWNSVSFSWSAVVGATGYTIYAFRSIPHAFLQGYQLGTPTGSPFTFTGVMTAQTLAPRPFPSFNNTYELLLFVTIALASTYPQVTFSPVTAGTFPFTPPQPATIAPGAVGFNAAPAIPSFSPYGGLIGLAGPLPQLIQFDDQAILILGNGYAPQATNPALGAAAPVTPLGNTFQAAYPTWQPSVDWITGAQVTDGAGNYYTATQGGVSETPGPPAWNIAKGAETADGSVVWTSQGPIPASIAPIGAAHAVAYAGSLWLANTWPVTTSYPSWQANHVYATGSQIVVVDGSGNSWIMQVQTGGTSGGTAPSWDFAVGGTTTDGTGGLVWYTLLEATPGEVAGIDGPSCLKMSDANNPNSWNPVNTAFVGRDDGTQITGLQPFTIAALGISPTGSLCLFKEFTTYQIIGVFGSTSFEIQPAQTNLGCIASRSIQFLPGFGVVRFTHLGFAVFDGINDRLISEDIRTYLFGGVDADADLTPVDQTYCYLAQSAQTVAPPMYLCAMPLAGGGGSLTRLFAYDLVMKAWAVLDLPWAISTLSTIAAGEGYPLVLAGRTNSVVQRMQSGDLQWDAGASDQTPVAWSFRSPEVFGEGSSQRLFYEQVTLRGYGNSAMVSSIIASLWLDGKQLGPLAADIVPQGGSNVFEVRFAIFRNGYRAHIDFSGTNGGAAGVIDAADWAVTEKSALARRIIS